MSILDTSHYWLPNAEKTELSGESLAHSLYTTPVDILLSGDLGAGKTTFLRGFARGLGISDPIVSPTFALEQRYSTQQKEEFIHIDCYRLTAPQIEKLLEASDDHTGIRCIEWADKIESPIHGAHIKLHFQEEADGRKLTITFADIHIPSMEDVARWREEVLLPENVSAHSDAVAAICDTLATSIQSQGRIVRRVALRRAAQLHDLLRFIDFQPSAQPKNTHHSKEEKVLWATMRSQYAEQTHEQAASTFLSERGFEGIGSMIAVHGAHIPTAERNTIEKKLLFYADKRAMGEKMVSVEERYEDFIQRYGSDAKKYANAWRKESLSLEQDLFPHGIPDLLE